MVLTETDRRVIRETAEDVRSSPPPSVQARLGIPAAVTGGIILLGWPRVVGQLPGGDFVSPFVTLLAVLLLVGGPALALLGAVGRGGSRVAVQAALARLRDPEADDETLIRAATVLVLHAYEHRGPTTAQVFDPAEVGAALGSGLALVEAVEHYLVEEGAANPAFRDRANEGE